MIAHIQSLRFVAAFWVVLYHAHAPLIPEAAMPALGAAWHVVAGMGFFGVDLFFVISGAVMATATRQTIEPTTGWRFLARRVSRVYAGWWPFFLLYLVANHFYRGLGQKDLLGSLLLWPLPHEQYLVPIVWTLSLELYFYVVLAALLHLPRARLRGALMLWASAVLACSAWMVARGLHTPERFHELGLLQTFFLSPYVLEFVAGFLLSEWLRARPRRHWWPWLAGGVVMVGAAAAYESLATLHPGGLAGWFHAPERVLLLGTAAVAIVAAAMIAPRPRAAFHRPLQRLGAASYSLYLCHILFLGGGYWAMERLGVGHTAPGLVFTLMLVAVVAASWLHHRSVELPLYRLALRFTLTRPSRFGASPP